uniref:2Fe-2S ferredoxin-type domain-containing protein n=1 Tax=Ananas comosus var. bracteatus TaxID=296719 RepID=A0A6V7NJM3_ANACO|nr:unnamed protein product [Ananas comosus var. bracteatus]
MGVLPFNSPLFSSSSISPCFTHNTTKKPHNSYLHLLPQQLSLISRRKLRAVETERVTGATAAADQAAADEETPSLDFAFVNSRLLPDGSPDVHYRSARGGQKLRDVMLDSHIDLYGPYVRCSTIELWGGGTCGTCIVEVVEGKEFLSPRTDKEKEILKKKPKTWRLACQTVVGKHDSRGNPFLMPRLLFFVLLAHFPHFFFSFVLHRLLFSSTAAAMAPPSASPPKLKNLCYRHRACALAEAAPR